MVEMNDSDNRGQGSRSDNAVPKSVRLNDAHRKLERIEAIHRQRSPRNDSRSRFQRHNANDTVDRHVDEAKPLSDAGVDDDWLGFERPVDEHAREGGIDDVRRR